MRGPVQNSIFRVDQTTNMVAIDNSCIEVLL